MDFEFYDGLENAHVIELRCSGEKVASIKDKFAFMTRQSSTRQATPANERRVGWLYIEMDTRALTLVRYKLIASLSLGGMLLGLLLFLVAFAISRYATRPIEEANRALYRLSRGALLVVVQGLPGAV